MNKIDAYLNMIYEMQMISEEVGIDIPNINKGFIQKINKSINTKDPYGSMKKIKTLAPPGFSINVVQKVENYMSKKYKKFSTFKSTASVVIKNSLSNVSPKMIDVASSFLSLSSMVVKKGDKNKKPNVILKTNLKKFINDTRAFGESYEDDDESSKSKMRPSDVADLAVAWVITGMAIIIASGLFTGGYVIGSAVYTFITGASFPGTLIVVFSIILLFAGCILGAKINKK